MLRSGKEKHWLDYKVQCKNIHQEVSFFLVPQGYWLLQNTNLQIAVKGEEGDDNPSEQSTN